MSKSLRIKAVVSIVLVVVLGVIAWLPGKHVVPILMYHRINSDNRLSSVVSPENFRAQIEYLKRHRYNVISLERFVTFVKENSRLPAKSIVITFDDGYEDNYDQAFKILKEYGFPATIFMITDLIDKEGYLTLKEIQEMESNHITFGSHTTGHVYLPGVPVNWQTYQIKESKRVLEEKLKHRIDFFAYPSGGFTDETKEIVKQAGYQAACTTNRGMDRFNKDIFELKRVRFSNKDNNLSMWIKLSGYYNLFRSPVSPY